MKVLCIFILFWIFLIGRSQNSYELLRNNDYDFSSVENKIDKKTKDSLIQKLINCGDSSFFIDLQYHYFNTSNSKTIKSIYDKFHIIDINNDNYLDVIIDTDLYKIEFFGFIIYLNNGQSFNRIMGNYCGKITNMVFKNQILDYITIYSEPGATRLFNEFELYKFNELDSFYLSKRINVPTEISKFPWTKRNEKIEIINDTVILRIDPKYLYQKPDSAIEIEPNGRKLITFNYHGWRVIKGRKGNILYEILDNDNKFYFVEILLPNKDYELSVCGFVKEDEILIVK